MILVSGAAGKTGRAAVAALTALGALVRRIAQVQTVRAAGSQEWLAGDVPDPRRYRTPPSRDTSHHRPHANQLGDTRWDHATEIKHRFGYCDFADQLEHFGLCSGCSRRRGSARSGPSPHP